MSEKKVAVQGHPGRLPTGEPKPGYDFEDKENKHPSDMNAEERKEFLKNGGKMPEYEGYAHDRTTVPDHESIEGVAGEKLAKKQEADKKAEVENAKKKKEDSVTPEAELSSSEEEHHKKKGLLDKVADKVGLGHHETGTEKKKTKASHEPA